MRVWVDGSDSRRGESLVFKERHSASFLSSFLLSLLRFEKYYRDGYRYTELIGDSCFPLHALWLQVHWFPQPRSLSLFTSLRFSIASGLASLDIEFGRPYIGHHSVLELCGNSAVPILGPHLKCPPKLRQSQSNDKYQNLWLLICFCSEAFTPPSP